MIAISDNVQVRKDKPSGTIVINRPNRRNALSREMVAALFQAFEDLYHENSVRAIILTGTGSTFCAGTDLQELKDTSEADNAAEVWHKDVTEFQQLIEYMLRCPKPIICGLNGMVVGSGAALMMASDIVIADQQANLVMPEVHRGLCSGIAATLLAHRIGTGQAANLLLTANLVDCEEALRLGLFQESVVGDLIWARCQELAQQIATGANQSQHLVKQLFNETINEDLFTHLSIGAANTATARTTDAAIEGITAFLEKREPEW